MYTDKIIAKKSIIGQVKVKIKLGPEYRQFCVGVTGNCLGSPLAPMRIKNGDVLVIHEVEKENPMRYAGKMVVVFINGKPSVKHCVFCRQYQYLTLKMYNPEGVFNVPWSIIDAVFIVDEVVTEHETIVLNSDHLNIRQCQ